MFKDSSIDLELSPVSNRPDIFLSSPKRKESLSPDYLSFSFSYTTPASSTRDSTDLSTQYQLLKTRLEETSIKEDIVAETRDVEVDKTGKKRFSFLDRPPPPVIDTTTIPKRRPSLRSNKSSKSAVQLTLPTILKSSLPTVWKRRRSYFATNPISRLFKEKKEPVVSVDDLGVRLQRMQAFEECLREEERTVKVNASEGIELL